MAPPTPVSRQRLVFFCSLYSLQGITVAYILTFNKSYMKAAGVKAETAALVETIALSPMIFKFLFGPISDRFTLLGLGRRVPYILLGLLVQAGGLAGLASFDPGKRLWLFGAMAFLTVLGLALYDTCCDGMVVDVTPPQDRSRIQGMLWTSRFLATMVSSLAFGVILQQTGVGPGKGEIVLWLCALTTLVPFGLGLAVREPARAGEAEAFNWRALEVLLERRSLALLGFGGIYAMVGVGAEFNLSPYYSQLGLGEGQIGGLAAVRNLGRALGAISLPLAWKHANRKGIFLGGLAALVASTALQAIDRGVWISGITAILFGMANGWNDALFAVLAMENSDPRMAASTFALLNAVTNLSIIGNYLFAQAVVLAHDRYPAVYLGASAVSTVLVVFAPLLSKKPPTRVEPGLNQ